MASRPCRPRRPWDDFALSLHGKIAGGIPLEAAPLQAKKLEYRYTDDFFREHDQVGSEVVNEELRRFAEPIRKLAAKWA